MPQPQSDNEPTFEAVAISRDGGTAVIVGDDGAILVVENIFSDIGTYRYKSRPSDRDDFVSVAFSGDEQTVIAVGRRGGIQFSTDGGGTWRSGTSNVSNRLQDVALNDNGSAAAVVGYDGTILISGNAGATWTFRDSRTAARLYAVEFGYGAGRKHAVAVGRDSTIFQLEAPGWDVVPVLSPEDITEVFLAGSDKRASQSARHNVKTEIREWSTAYLVNLNVIRGGVVMILLFMAHYLTSLSRYCLRLAAFYDARQDAVRLMGLENETPSPENAKELEQMMHALTPYGLDFGRSSRTMMGMAMEMARLISGRPERNGKINARWPGLRIRKNKRIDIPDDVNHGLFILDWRHRRFHLLSRHIRLVRTPCAVLEFA